MGGRGKLEWAEKENPTTTYELATVDHFPPGLFEGSEVTLGSKRHQ
jgi:hypothetical protein